MAHDEMKEQEKTVDYESFMKECLACESVYKSKISTPEIPGLPEGLFDSVEQTALTRAKATLSMIAILEKVADEQEARKKLRKTKLLNNMSVMKPSELWKVAVDNRVRSLLKSESSQKGMGKGEGKGKNKTFDPLKLYSLHQDHNGPLSEDQVEQVTLHKKVKSPAGAGAKSSTSKTSGKGSKPWSGTGTAKGKKWGQEVGKTQPKNAEGHEQRKDLWEGQAGERPTFPWIRERAKAKTRKVHKWRIQQR